MSFVIASLVNSVLLSLMKYFFPHWASYLREVTCSDMSLIFVFLFVGFFFFFLHFVRCLYADFRIISNVILQSLFELVGENCVFWFCVSIRRSVYSENFFHCSWLVLCVLNILFGRLYLWVVYWKIVSLISILYMAIAWSLLVMRFEDRMSASRMLQEIFCDIQM